MKYTVELSRNGVVNAEYRNMSETAAIKAAEEERGHGNDIYITWYRKSDGMHGFLNPDGNHSISGRNWAKDYCTQNDGDCETCSLVNYGRDCQNNKI